MNEPLAQRLRPKTLADVCGQQHLLAEGQVFRRAGVVEFSKSPNKECRWKIGVCRSVLS